MRHESVDQASDGGEGRKHPEGDRHAQVVDGEPPDEAPDPASDPEIWSAENTFNRCCRRHRRIGFDEGEDGDQEEGGAERFQSFQK